MTMHSNLTGMLHSDTGEFHEGPCDAGCKSLPNGACVGKTCMHTRTAPLLVTIPCKVHGGHEFYVAEGKWTCASECRAAWAGEDTQGTHGERQRDSDPQIPVTGAEGQPTSPPKNPKPRKEAEAVEGASPSTASDDLRTRAEADVKASGKSVKKFFDALLAKDLKMKKQKMKRTGK